MEIIQQCAGGRLLRIKQQHYVAVPKITLTLNHWHFAVPFKLTPIIPSNRQ